MCVSVKSLPRLTPPTLSGMLLLLLSAPVLAQGTVKEVVGTAAKPVQTVHYMAELTMECNSAACSGEFPGPGAQRQLNITQMACDFQTTSNAIHHAGFFTLQTSDNSVDLLDLYLPFNYSWLNSNTSSRHSVLNQTVDIQVRRQQKIRIAFFQTGGTPKFGRCTASGTRDTF